MSPPPPSSDKVSFYVPVSRFWLQKVQLHNKNKRAHLNTGSHEFQGILSSFRRPEALAFSQEQIHDLSSLQSLSEIGLLCKNGLCTSRTQTNSMLKKNKTWPLFLSSRQKDAAKQGFLEALQPWKRMRRLDPCV